MTINRSYYRSDLDCMFTYGTIILGTAHWHHHHAMEVFCHVQCPVILAHLGSRICSGSPDANGNRYLSGFGPDIPFWGSKTHFSHDVFPVLAHAPNRNRNGYLTGLRYPGLKTCLRTAPIMVQKGLKRA